MNKVQNRCLRSIRRQSLHDQAVQHTEWRTSAEGISQRDRLIGGASDVARMAPFFHNVPCAKGLSTAFWSSTINGTIPRSVAALRTPEYRELADLFLKGFDDSCMSLLADDQPPVPELPKTKPGQKPKCIDVGVCLCCERGNTIWRFKKLLCNKLKEFCKHPRVHRLLGSGDLVIRLRGMNRTADGTFAFDENHDEYCGLPMIIWTPYKPSFRLLQGASETDWGTILLDASDAYFSVWELAEEYTRDVIQPKDWHVTLLELDNCMHPVANLKPKCVEVKSIIEVASVDGFLPVTKQHRARTRAERALDEVTGADDVREDEREETPGDGSHGGQWIDDPTDLCDPGHLFGGLDVEPVVEPLDDVRESEAYSNVPGSDLIGGLLTPRSMDSDGGDGPIEPADTASVNSEEKAFVFFCCGSLPPQALLARATDSLRRTLDGLASFDGLVSLACSIDSLRSHIRRTRFARVFDRSSAGRAG